SAFDSQVHYKTVGPRYVHGSLVPDIGVDGVVYGYYELTRDLTDLKRSQELLRSTEDRLGLLMDSLTDHAILSLDPDGLIDSWNKGAELIFGYTHREIMGRSGDILFTPEDIARGIPSKEMRTARRTGRALDQRWHLRKDGTRFFADGVMMPVHVGSVLAGYAKIASDLTERKRRDEELQRAHEELEERVTERTTELVASNDALVNEMDERAEVEAQRSDLLRRLVSSQEMERQRIARDLHDQLGQRLTALRLKIASLNEVTGQPELLATRIERLQEIAERLDSEVSFLAWELRPSALDDLGLSEAIGAFVNEWSRNYEIAADFRSTRLLHERLDRDLETHLYRITQEALNNISKHAFANHVSVLLESREKEVLLIIEDNGVGFEVGNAGRPRESGKGLGLLGMRERASLVGGAVEIESAPGKGATIYVRVPFSN
ncbi:MAG: PAS domain-containing sensor histidine kinase, partial [Pyrinomonadaceae bacterium]